MKISNKILNNATNFILPFSLFIGLGITKIVNTANNDAWISIIIGTLFGLLLNYLLTKLPDKNNIFIDLIINLFLLFIGIITLIKLISSVYLDRTNSLFIMIPFIILLIYTTTKNEYAIKKTVSILIIINILLILFASLSLLPKIDSDYFKPIFINRLPNILCGSLEYALYSTIPLLILPKYKEKYSYKSYIISSLTLLLLFILVIGNLGLELSKSYRYPEYMIFKNISILDFIENIENFLFFIWVINIYTLTANTSLNIKNIIGQKLFIILIIIISLLINIFVINNYKVPIFLLKYIDLILLIILILYILSKIIYNKKYTNY